MKVEFKNSFIKLYKRRFGHNVKLQAKFSKRLKMFSEDSKNPLLHDHSLQGDLLGHRSFSIAGDIRVIYYVKDEIAYFVDIGSHNQVY